MTTIILTSTVYVHSNVEGISQPSPHDRLQIYLKSIHQWLNKTNMNIVLVENSGYTFDELNEEKIKYKDRFEIISFDEKTLESAKYLNTPGSKGPHEMFAINYAYQHSHLLKSANFIIKITGRYFIPELEEYLSRYNLNMYNCLTQNDRGRCEMVGSHKRYFNHIFNVNVKFCSAEELWSDRTAVYKNVLVCKEFHIEQTARGCYFSYFNTI
jgi:hypothetical protein